MCEKRGLRAKVIKVVHETQTEWANCNSPKASSLLIFLDGMIKYCLKKTSETNMNSPGITTHGLATIDTTNIANVLNCN